MAKVAIISDTHAGVRNSNQIFIDYQKRFYSEVFFPYLEQHNINQIWHLGDYYDNRRNIDLRTLNANRKMFLEPLVENKIHMTIIPGNHDVAFKNSNHVCSLKELLGYYTENVTILMDPTEVVYDNTRVLWIPWINQENFDQIMKSIEKSTADVLLGHLELNGYEMYKGVKAPGEKNSEFLSKFSKVLTGHYHTKSKGDNVYYLGSQMEFTWADCDDQKYFHVFDTETQELTAVPNPIKLFKKVRYNDETSFTTTDDYKEKFVRVIIEEKNDAYEFDRFIEQIENSYPLDLKITDASVYGDFATTDMELDETEIQTATENTLSFIGEYIESIETSLDKDRLKKTITSIFNEAETLELN